jgi:hypothetical protein
MLAQLGLTLALPACNAFAAETQHVSFGSAAAHNKITEQIDMAVGDLPDHFVRVFEVHRTFPDNPPLIDGLKLVEVWERGTADLSHGNGTATTYDVYVMENGDRFFGRTSNIVRTVARSLETANLGFITGGTGKLAGMQGIIRVSATATGKGVNENRVDIDYSIADRSDPGDKSHSLLGGAPERARRASDEPVVREVRTTAATPVPH